MMLLISCPVHLERNNRSCVLSFLCAIRDWMVLANIVKALVVRGVSHMAPLRLLFGGTINNKIKWYQQNRCMKLPELVSDPLLLRGNVVSAQRPSLRPPLPHRSPGRPVERHH